MWLGFRVRSSAHRISTSPLDDPQSRSRSALNNHQRELVVIHLELTVVDSAFEMARLDERSDQIGPSQISLISRLLSQSD